MSRRGWLLTLSVALTGAFSFIASAAATPNDTFTQHIFPMDCIFNEVNDGTATYAFLTPAACGVLQPAASINDQSGQAGNGSAPAAGVRGNGGRTGASRTATSPPTTGGTTGAGGSTAPIQNDNSESPSIQNDALRSSRGIVMWLMAGVAVLMFWWLIILSRRRRKKDEEEEAEARHEAKQLHKR